MSYVAYITQPQQGSSMSLLDSVFHRLVATGVIPQTAAGHVKMGVQSILPQLENQLCQKSQQMGTGLSHQQLEATIESVLKQITIQTLQTNNQPIGGGITNTINRTNNQIPVYQVPQVTPNHPTTGTVIAPNHPTTTGPGSNTVKSKVDYPVTVSNFMTDNAILIGETVRKRMAQGYYTYEKELGSLTEEGKEPTYYSVVSMELEGDKFLFDSDQSVVTAINSLVDRQEVQWPGVWIITYGRMTPLNIQQDDYLSCVDKLRQTYTTKLGRVDSIPNKLEALRSLLPVLNRMDIINRQVLEQWMVKIINRILNQYGRSYDLGITSLNVADLDQFLNKVSRPAKQNTKLGKLQTVPKFSAIVGQVVLELEAWLLDNGTCSAVLIGEDHVGVEAYLNCSSVLAMVHHSGVNYNKGAFHTVGNELKARLVEEMRMVTLMCEMRTLVVLHPGNNSTLDELASLSPGFCTSEDCRGIMRFALGVMSTRKMVPDGMVSMNYDGSVQWMWSIGNSVDKFWYLVK